MNETASAGPRCSKCRNAFVQDTGYSNYTVEGSSIYCLKGLRHSFDRWYGHAAEDAFAAGCPSFEPDGPAFEMDVDCTRVAELSPEMRGAYHVAITRG